MASDAARQAYLVAAVRVSGESGTICAPPVPKLQLIAPTTGSTFSINATPAMPGVTAQARITGVTPDPTATTSFTWTVTLKLDASSALMVLPAFSIIRR